MINSTFVIVSTIITIIPGLIGFLLIRDLEIKGRLAIAGLLCLIGACFSWGLYGNVVGISEEKVYDENIVVSEIPSGIIVVTGDTHKVITDGRSYRLYTKGNYKLCTTKVFNAYGNVTSESSYLVSKE